MFLNRVFNNPCQMVGTDFKHLTSKSCDDYSTLWTVAMTMIV